MESGDVICEDCGETNKPGTEFCMFCGAYLGWQEQPASPSANEVTQPLRTTPAAASAPSQPVDPPAARQAAPTGPAPAGPAPVASAPAGSAPVASASVSSASAGRARGGREPVTRQQPASAATVAPGAPATQPGAHDGATALAAAVAQTEPLVPNCPTCGRRIEDGRRFCAHCGQQFVMPGAGGTPVRRPPSKRDTWWSRLWDTKDRAARRTFRRSLPPLYRWRRVIIVILSLGLIAGGLTLLHHSPKSFVMARYYDIKKTLVMVKPIDARTIPPDTSAQDTKPSALVDNTKAAWMMNWSPSTRGAVCGSPPTTPVVELAFQPVRLREIDLYPGLAKDNPYRTQQFRPKDIWIAYGSECKSYTLDDVDLYKITLDTKLPVGSVRFSVIDAYPPDQPAGAQQMLGFTEIRLLSRPRT